MTNASSLDAIEIKVILCGLRTHWEPILKMETMMNSSQEKRTSEYHVLGNKTWGRWLIPLLHL